jgi:uracil-DNA glycosylase
MVNFNSQILEFWNDVQQVYDPIQNETGLTFYVFQTSYGHEPNPDLMIIGINPAGEYGNEKFLVNKMVEQGKFKNMYIDWMYKEEVNEAENEWFNTLCSVFDYPKNPEMKKILENAVGTNCFYINTGSVESLNKQYDAKKLSLESKKLVKKLIQIIKPKKILTLGETPFNSVKDSKVELIAVNDKNNIKSSFCGNIPVYNIPNPSRIHKNQYYTGQKLIDYQNGLAKLLR